MQSLPKIDSLDREFLLKTSNARLQFEKRKATKQRQLVKEALKTVSVPHVNQWNETTYFYTGISELDAKLFNDSIKALKVTAINTALIDEIESDRLTESDRNKIIAKVLQRRKRKSLYQAQKAAKKEEYAQYRQAKHFTAQNLAKIPVIEKALQDIPDRITAANLRRRLEVYIKDGSIKLTELNQAFNAVSQSSVFKDLVIKKLKKYNVKIIEPVSKEFFREFVNYDCLIKMDIKERGEVIKNFGIQAGISEDEAFNLYREVRNDVNQERRRKTS